MPALLFLKSFWDLPTFPRKQFQFRSRLCVREVSVPFDTLLIINVIESGEYVAGSIDE